MNRALCAALLVALAWAVPARALGPLPAAGSLEVYFTPWEDAEAALLKTINDARQTIHVQAYAFTSRNVAWALSQAHQRGIKVEVLADAEQNQRNPRGPLALLRDEGIPVWLEVRYAAAHNKVMLMDAESAAPTVVTGSYNFTFAAQARNAENLLILHGNPQLARAYLANWQRHRMDAAPWAAPHHAHARKKR